MDTLLLNGQNENATQMAADILANGGVVAIPTETVYGLAANALDEAAVHKIFAAKGRPADNPLIVHIAQFEDMLPLVQDVPNIAKTLAKAFWPGPFTMILPKSNLVPNVTSGNLSTVAIRMPNHKQTREIIRLASFPVAAPSANTSGKPSPTTAQHVLEDMNGKIDAIFNGGQSSVGVESTVITFRDGVPHILRPGAITPADIEKVAGKVTIDKVVFSPAKQGEQVLSPGVKYRHYAPKANVFLLNGTSQSFAQYVNSQNAQHAVAICFDEDIRTLHIDSIVYGKQNDDKAQANAIFDALRSVDKKGYDTVYVHAPKQEGIGLAIYNRLLHASSFQVIDL